MSRYIGINHMNGLKFGGIDSSFNGEFIEERVLVQNGIGDIVPCVIGNVRDAYEILSKLLKERKPGNFEELMEIVFETIQTYFGDYQNISERMKNYPDIDMIEGYHYDIGAVANLKGKNAAMCVERAMLAQNLLKLLCIHSFYKASGIMKDGKLEGHAYNLVEYEDKFYVFDSAIPTIHDDKIYPIVAEVPKEVFEMLSSPSSDIGYAVSVSHFNPLRNQDVNVIYDFGRKQTFDYRETRQKS